MDPLDQIGSCAGCDLVKPPLDDLGLCTACAAKLDRDLIRERAWDYSATAFGWNPDDYESLRQQVIEQYGASYELIIPDKQVKKRRRRKRHR